MRVSMWPNLVIFKRKFSNDSEETSELLARVAPKLEKAFPKGFSVIDSWVAMDIEAEKMLKEMKGGAK